MGDHRASVKITFEAHGVRRNLDAYWNWCPDHSGLDPRIAEWFEDAWEAALVKYRAECERLRVQNHERFEREELQRLQAKYGSNK